MSSGIEGRKIDDLRVVDLKLELEKRGLDKNGNKQILIERLKKALEAENIDSESHTFPAPNKDLDQSQSGDDDTVTIRNDVEIKQISEEATNGVADSAAGDSKKDVSVEESCVKEENATAGEEQTEGKGDESVTDNKVKESEKAADERKDDKPTVLKTEDKSKTTPSKKDSDTNRNIWITNISQNTRATELKQALSKHGKVVGAKVVINARNPAACCYGYVKMETVADADNCIAKLNNTELNGQIIRLEKVRPDHFNSLKNKIDNKDKGKEVKGGHKIEVKEEKKDIGDKKMQGEKKPDKPERKEKREVRRFPIRSRSKDRRSREKRRSPSHGGRSLSSKSAPRREREMLTFDKIKDERERERARERERILRERRREEVARQREIEREQRSEAARLEREREKLRRERERLERERAEFMQFERERQKIEREKLELERIELERAKIRIQEEERRSLKRPAPPSYNRDRERSFEDRKRVASDRHFDEAPPPPRFEPPSSLKRNSPPSNKKYSSSSSKDYKSGMSFDKRNSYSPKRDYKDRGSHPSSMQRGGTMTKYESNSYSRSDNKNDMRGDPRAHDSGNMSLRHDGYKSIKVTFSNYRNHGGYPDQQKEPIRYDRPSGNNGNPQKVFGGTNAPSKQQWNKDAWRNDNSSSGNRWPTSQQGNTEMSSQFSAPGMNMAACPPPPGINNYVSNRFDYKGNMGNMRKY